MKITAEEALEKMEDEGAPYLDVRTVEEFEGGHPEGAYNIPIKLRGPTGFVPNADFLSTVSAHFEKGQTLIVGCLGGIRSKAAAELLSEAGYVVFDQFAGWSGAKDEFGTTLEPGWQACGLPMALEAEPGRAYAALARDAQ